MVDDTGARVDDVWVADLRSALLELGIEPGRARDLAADCRDEARAAGAPARDLFGPAVLYARTMHQALHATPSPRAGAGPRGAAGRPLLVLDGVGKRYGGKVVLSDVRLTVRAGEVAAVVGSNGAGKTTLLRICAGLTRATSGTVHRTARIGYVPQEAGFAGQLTVHEHIRLLAAVHGIPAGRAIATAEQLAARLAWRPQPGAQVRHLSGGTRQKLNVVLGRLSSPDLLLLDEPYQGFDHGAYVDFWEQVDRWRDGGAGVVVVTHLLHELDRADHVVELPAPRGE